MCNFHSRDSARCQKILVFGPQSLCAFQTQLKKIMVDSFGASKKELSVIKLLLGTAVVLEEMLIRKRIRNSFPRTRNNSLEPVPASAS